MKILAAANIGWRRFTSNGATCIHTKFLVIYADGHGIRSSSGRSKAKAMEAMNIAPTLAVSAVDVC